MAGMRPANPSPAPGRFDRWLARGMVTVAAAILSLAFPEPGLWWLAWLGLAPVLALIALSPSRREALFRSWLAGVGYLTALHYWVIPHTGIFTIILAAFVGLFWLPLGLAAWWSLGPDAGRERRMAGLAVLPSVWVVIEAVRSWEHLGGTWGLLGLSQWNSALTLQSAALGGVWLLSFVLVAVNVALASAFFPGRQGGERLSQLGVAVALPLLVVAYAAVRPEPAVTGTLTLGGVQPGVFEAAADRLDAHVATTHDVGDSAPEVIVWGQTSVAYDPAVDAGVDARLRELVAMMGTDLLVNIDARSDGGIVKTTVQYSAEGPVAEYGKQRLVPFGEYIPLRPVLGWVAGYTEAASEDRARGQGLVVMNVAGTRLGPLVSYESTFPDMRRDLARLGVDLTVVQGGTQTFQGTWAQPQQASYEAVNAVASGRPAVLVAVSGVSAAFDIRGEVLAWHPSDWTGAFVVEVPLAREETLYVRFGDWVIWLSVIVVGVALVAQVMGRAGGPPDH